MTNNVTNTLRTCDGCKRPRLTIYTLQYTHTYHCCCLECVDLFVNYARDQWWAQAVPITEETL